MRRCHLLSLIVAFPLFCASARAQAPSGDAPGPDEKTARYHGMLLKRPKPGAIFERFESAWMETGSLDSLKAFLQKRASAPAAAVADGLVLGFFLSRQNEHEEAIAAFAKALEKEPGNADAWLLRAQAETRMMDFTTALKSLAQIKLADGGDTALDAAKLRARLLIRTGETTQALEALTALAAARPEDEDLQDEVMELQVEEGLMADAVMFLSGVIEKTKDPYLRVMRRLRLGDLHQRAGNRDQALDTYVGCLADAGQDSWVESEVIAQIEQVFRRKDDVAGLREMLDRIAPDHAQRAALGMARARVLAEAGAEEEALKLLADLISKNPGSTRLREQHLELLTKLKKHQEAVAQMREMLARKPEDKDLKFRLCGLYYLAGQDAPAVGILDEILAAKDATEYDHLRVARFFESVNEPKDARRAYLRTTEKFTESVAAQEAFAAFLHGSNEKERALAIWRKLAEKSDKEALLRIARALSARAEHDTALELLKKHAGSAPDKIFITQMVLAAVGAKKHDEARDQSLQLVRSAATPQELDDALRLARTVHREQEAALSLISALKSKKDALIQERCLLADLLEDAGDPEAADAALTKAEAADLPVALRQRARLAQRRQDFDKAAAALEALVALPGMKKPAEVESLTLNLSRGRRFADALKWAAEWKSLQPGSPRPWLEEARALEADSRAPAAIEVLRVAARKFDDDTSVASALASAYRGAGQLADSQRVYGDLFEKASDLPAQLRWAGMMAEVAQQRGVIADLISLFEERQRGNRQSVTPWLLLAEVHRASGNYEGRRNALLEAARLKPEDVDLLHQIARAEEGEGDWRRAVESLEKALPHDKSTRTRERIAALHFEYGDEETGLRIVAELAGGDKMDPRLAENLALGLMQNGNWAAALTLLDPVLAREIEDYRLRCLRAICLQESDRADEAAEEFLKLCSVRTELKGSTAAPWDEDERRYLDFPPGVEPLARLAYTFNASNTRSYFDQNRQQSRWSARSGSSQAQNIWILPPNVQAAPYYGAGYLIRLSADWPAEKRAALARRVSATGLDAARGMTDFKPGPEGGLMLAEERGDLAMKDPTLASWWLMDVMDRGPGAAESEDAFAARLRQCMELLRPRHPVLAFAAAMRLWRENPAKHAGAARLAAEILGEIPPDRGNWTSYLTQTLGQLPASAQTSEEARSILKAAIVAQTRRKEKNPEDRSHANWWSAFLLAKLRDWDGFVTVLNEEAEAWRTKEAIRDEHANRRSYATGNVSIQPLPFPLRAMPDLPDWLPGMLDDDFPRQTGLEEADLAALKSKAAGVKNALARMCVLSAVGDREGATKLAAERAAAKDASMSELMCAAALASEQGDPVQAAAHLARARSMGGDLRERSAIDAALAHAAMQAIEAGQSEKIAPHLEASRAAALHLRYLMGGGGNLDSLADALAKLGLADEAARIKRFIAASQSSGSRMGSSSFRNPDPEDMKKLLNKGQRDQAIALAVRALRAGADQALNPQGGSFYGLDSWLDRIKDARLEEQVWEAAKAPSSAGFRPLVQHALVAEMLGHFKEARAALEECVKQRPREAVLRFRLAGAMLRDGAEPKAALEQLLQADKRDAGRAAETWAEHLDDSEDIQYRNLATETMALYLDHWAERAADTPQGWWATRWENQALEAVYLDEGRAPHLLWRKDYEQQQIARDDKKPDPALLKARATAYERFARAGMRHPLFAPFLFPAYSAHVLKSGGDLAAAEKLARDAVQRFGEEARRRRESFQWAALFGSAGYSSPQPEEAPRLSAPDFLLLRAFQAGKPASVQKELAPLVEKALGPDAARCLVARARLYFDPEEKFREAFEEWQKTLPANFRRDDSGQSATEMVRFWELRAMKMPPADLLAPVIQDTIKRGDWINDDVIVRVARLARERLGADGLAAFVEAISALYLGSKEGRKEFVARNGPRPGSRTSAAQGSATWRVEQLSNLLEELSDTPETYFAAVRAARAAGMEKTEDYDDIVRCDGMDEVYGDVDRAWAIIQESGFLNDVEDLDVIPGSGPSELSGLESLINQIIGSRSRFQRDDFRKQLGERVEKLREENPTLGVALFNHASAHVLGLTIRSLADVFSKIEPRFAALPPGRQKELATVIARQMGVANTLNPAYGAAKRFPSLTAAVAAVTVGPVDEILAAKTFADTGLTEEGFRSAVLNAVAEIVDKEPERATKLFAHAARLIADKQRASGWQSSRDNGYNVATSIFNTATQIAPSRTTGSTYTTYRGSSTTAATTTKLHSSYTSQLGHGSRPGGSTPNRVRFALALLTAPEQRDIVHYGWAYNCAWSAELQNSFNSNGGWANPADTALIVCQPYLDHADQGGAMLAVLPFTDWVCSAASPWHLREMAAGLRKGPAPAREKMAQAIEIALALAAMSGWNGDIPDAAKPIPPAITQSMETAAAWLADAKLNPLARITFAAHVLRYGGRAVQPAMVRQAMGLVSESLENSWPAGGWLLHPVLTSFSRLPKDAAWDEIAARFMSAWVKRCANDASEPEEFGRGFWPERDCIFAPLEVFAKSGDPRMLDRFILMHGSLFEKSPAAALVLTRHGATKQARAIIERATVECDSKNYARDLAHTAADEKALEALLPALRPAWAKAGARILTGAAVDAIRPALAGWDSARPWNQRLELGAKELLALQGADAAHVAHLWRHVNESPAACLAMLPWARQQADTRRAWDVIRDGAEGNDDIIYLAGITAVCEGIQGDPKRMIELAATLRAGCDKNQGGPWSDRLSKLQEIVYERGRIWVRDADAAGAERLLALCDPLVKETPRRSSRSIPLRVAALRAGLLALLDKKDDVDWAARLAGKSSISVEYSSDAAGIIERVAYALCVDGGDNRKLRPLEQRLRVIGALLGGHPQMAMAHDSRSPNFRQRPLQLVRSRGVISGDEIRKHALELFAITQNTGVLADAVDAFLETGDQAGAAALLKAAAGKVTLAAWGERLGAIAPVAGRAFAAGDKDTARAFVSLGVKLVYEEQPPSAAAIASAAARKGKAGTTRMIKNFDAHIALTAMDSLLKKDQAAPPGKPADKPEKK